MFLKRCSLDENNVQDQQTPFDFEANLYSKTMVLGMAYPNVIITNDNLNLMITNNLEILQNFLKDRDTS